MKHQRLLASMLFTVLLAACGGGGGGGDNATPPPIVNTAPVASAGADQSILTNAVVTLDGSKSSDANGDSLTYAWTLATKPAGSAASLSSSTSAMPTFTADVAGTYVATLIVNDGKVARAVQLARHQRGDRSLASSFSYVATLGRSQRDRDRHHADDEKDHRTDRMRHRHGMQDLRHLVRSVCHERDHRVDGGQPRRPALSSRRHHGGHNQPGRAHYDQRHQDGAVFEVDDHDQNRQKQSVGGDHARAPHQPAAGLRADPRRYSPRPTFNRHVSRPPTQNYSLHRV